MSIIDTIKQQFAKEPSPQTEIVIHNSAGHQETLRLARENATAIAQKAKDAAQREADHRQGLNARIVTDLQQPRRTLQSIEIDIAARRADQTALAAELATITAEIDTGDHEPNVKTTQRVTQIQLTLRGIAANLQKLEVERQDAQRLARLDQYQAKIADYLDMADELTAFESSPEWIEAERIYLAGMEKRRSLRHRLEQWQVHRVLGVFTQDAPELGADFKALEAGHHDRISVSWKQV